MIKLEGLTDEQIERMFPFHTIGLMEVGSRSHGTWQPKDDPTSIDDIDLMGVYIGPIEAYFGFGRQETVERKFGEWGAYDCVSYDLRHFVSLLMKSNPNVLGTLWMKDEHVIFTSPLFEALRVNRNLFTTQYAYKSFAGYAQGQLHRMTHFDGPARTKMMEVEKELERRHIPLNYTPEELQAERPDLFEGTGSLKGGEKIEDRPYAREFGAQLLRVYREMCNKYTSGYMGKKRRELVEKFGYDTKNAAHLIRLLKMCGEFMLTGELHVDRTDIDAEELKKIKRGEWTLKEVQQYSEQLSVAAKAARDASTLPKAPDRDKVEGLLVKLLGVHFRYAALEKFDAGQKVI